MTQAIPPSAAPPAAPPSAAPAAPSASVDPGAAADADSASGFGAVLQEKMAAPAKGQAETDKIAAPAVDPAAESAAASDPAAVVDPAALATMMPQLAALLGVLAGNGANAPASADGASVSTAPLQPSKSAADTPLPGAPHLPELGAAARTQEAAAGEPSVTARGEGLAATDSAARSSAAPASSGNSAALLHAASAKETSAQAIPSAMEGAAASAQTQTQLHATGNPVTALQNSPVRAGEAIPTQHISTPLGAAGWSTEIGQKVLLLAGRNDSRAELTLTPPHLGKLDIILSMSGEQTSATFVSASQAARDALEQALPRLREMLADAGITLGQTSVNARASGQDAQNFSSGQHSGAGNEQADASAPAAARTHWLQRSEGLVDTFA